MKSVQRPLPFSRTALSVAVSAVVALTVAACCDEDGGAGDREGLDEGEAEDGCEGEAALSISPAVHDFGSLAVGWQSEPARFIVSNTCGAGPSDVINVAITAGFVLTGSNCALLEEGESCTLTSTFNPSNAGVTSGALTVLWSGASAASASLRGAGTAPP